MGRREAQGRYQTCDIFMVLILVKVRYNNEGEVDMAEDILDYKVDFVFKKLFGSEKHK
mgnify:CR=1 FL=1